MIMKTIIVFFIAVLLATFSYCQVQSAGDIDTLSQWRVDINWTDGYGVYTDHFKYYISGTKVVDTFEYYEVFKSGYVEEFWGGIIYYYDHSYGGVLRENDNKWYSRTENNEDGLLYDFTLLVGDTIVSNVAPTGANAIIVIAIDTIQINGEDKKRFHLSCAQSGGAQYIIEDVGSTAGLFEWLGPYFEIIPFMHCFAIDYIPLWINPDGFECDLSVRIEECNNQTNVFISPNPFTTSTTLSFILDKPENVQFTIYNVQAQIVYRMQEQQDKGEQQIQWNAEGIPAGMYYFRIQAGYMVGGGKMVKME